MDNYEKLQGKRIGFIGFGDIAEKAVQHLNSQHQENGLLPAVSAYRRQPEKINQALCLHETVAIDVTKAESLAVLEQSTIDYWVVTLTPPALTEDDYRATYVEGLKNILHVLKGTHFEKLFWVSSSSVYGQANDEWVDETSATIPQRFSGKVQLEAEQLVRALGDKGCVVRFSGIYREKRHRMVENLRQHKVPALCECDYYTNRIHVHDAARTLLHLMHCQASGELLDALYLASDSTPVKYSDLILWLSKTVNLPLNTGLPAAKQRVNSKRCSNKRLKETGFKFIYDGYKDGFAQYL